MKTRVKSERVNGYIMNARKRVVRRRDVKREKGLIYTSTWEGCGDSTTTDKERRNKKKDASMKVCYE